jgi:16S rRNA (uracil1498-N3)-methyltransferase
LKHLEFFLVEPDCVFERHLEIRGTEFEHLAFVLRKQVGDSGVAVDGQGNAYDFFIEHISKDRAKGQIQKRRRLVGESIFRLTLAQSVLKGNHLDLVVEKATEVGIAAFIPMLTTHTIPQPSDQKVSRLQRIAREAMKQSCRSVFPEIHPVQSFEEIVQQSSRFQLKLMAHQAKESLPLRLLPNDLRVSHFRSGILLVGPEGGFSTQEVMAAQQYGFQLLSLGKRRLRAETAGIVGAALLIEKLEDN